MQVDDYWEPAKKQLLADAKGFMDSLVKFDKDNIPDRIIKKVGWWSHRRYSDVNIRGSMLKGRSRGKEMIKQQQLFADSYGLKEASTTF